MTTVTEMTGNPPLLFDTSSLDTIARASEVPTITSSLFSYAPATTAGELDIPRVKDGWALPSEMSSGVSVTTVTVPALPRQSTSTKALNGTTIEASPATGLPAASTKPKEPMSPLWIAIIVLCVFILVVVIALVAFIALRRRTQNRDNPNDNQDEEPMVQTENSRAREPELSWMSGPTLIEERNSQWSTGTLVPPQEGHHRRGENAVPGAVARPMPPIPERSLSRGSEPPSIASREPELPSTPGGFTPLMTPVSPIDPARRGHDGVHNEVPPGDEMYRPSPVSPLEGESLIRGLSVKEV